MKKISFFTGGLFLIGVSLLSCIEERVSKTGGEELARQYCASCHAFPEPEILNRKIWKEEVLPRMGALLGVWPDASEEREAIAAGYRNGDGNLWHRIPDQPMLAPADWKALCSFYLKAAPDSLVLPDRPVASVDTSLFAPRWPKIYLSPPSTTLTRFLGNGQLAIGDAHSQKLFVFDGNLELMRAAVLREGAVDVTVDSAYWLVTLMGSFSPTDEPSGFLLQLPVGEGLSPRVVIDSLRRPVSTEVADLNGDNRADLVICEFGKWQGGVSWYQNTETGFEKQELLPFSGATETRILDLDANGSSDILALMAQADESIVAFYNDGSGKFREERLLRFSPSWGSSSFDLADFDGDGYLDIIHTAGDNADFGPVLRPYHGIRVFRNDGQNRFSEHWFYPLPGAYRAIVRDFDLDGDMDVAAISFFPDFEDRPEESFVFLRNDGDGVFTPCTFPGVTNGRWIVMDAADYDSDGDEDLVLGSLAFEVVPPGPFLKRWVEQGIPFVVLENRTR